MFINFVLAANIFDMPASLFAKYLEFFDIEAATPMQTWDQGTRRIYESLTAGFRDKIHLNRPVRRVYRQADCVVVEDEDGVQETFDQVVFACNADQTLSIIDAPTPLERYILSRCATTTRYIIAPSSTTTPQSSRQRGEGPGDAEHSR